MIGLPIDSPMMSKRDKDKKDKQKAQSEAATIPLALSALEPTDVPDNLVSILLFEIGGDSFAVGVDQTEGVVDCPRVTPLPSAPDGMIGVASVRGRMTLVMDFSRRANPSDGKRRLILLKGESQLGLLAERVEGVVALEPEKIRKQKGSDKSERADESHWAAPAHFNYEGRQILILDVSQLVEI